MTPPSPNTTRGHFWEMAPPSPNTTRGHPQIEQNEPKILGKWPPFPILQLLNASARVVSDTRKRSRPDDNHPRRATLA